MTLLLFLLIGHQLNTSYVEIVEDGPRLKVAIDLDPHDVPFLARIDSNKDAVVTESEVMAMREQFFQFAFAHFQAKDTGVACTWERSADSDRWDGTLRLWHGETVFSCPKNAAELTLYLAHLDSLPRSHRALVRVNSGLQTVLKHGDAIIEARVVPAPTLAWRFVTMGAEHIGTGWDHLAFILALLLGVTKLRDAVIALTAFTLAHSLTLALAWLSVVALPARIVEPVIALSIVCVGVENLRPHRSLQLRTAMAFAFGLIHGLGFASALGDAHFAKQSLVLSLLSFNVGVELAQVGLVVLVWPVGKRLAKGRRIASVGLACLGLVWAVQRVL